MRIGRLFVVALLVLVACRGSTPSATDSEAPSPSPSGSPTMSPEPPTFEPATALAYDTQAYTDAYDMAAGDLWTYLVASGELRRLTFDGESTWETDPLFTPDGTAVVYLVKDFETGKDSLWRIDLSDDPPSPTKILSSSRRIAAFTLHPDGERIAYIRDENNGTSTVRIYSGGPNAQTIKTLPAFLGRGGTDTDEIRLAWRANGKRLLIIDTRRDSSEETLWVVNNQGTDTVTPRFGTFGRWAPDGKRVYYRSWDDESWFELSLASDTTTGMAIARQAFRPSVSPDGAYLSYDDGGEHPSVFAFDVAAGTEAKLADDAIAPLWLTLNRVVVSETEPCLERFADEPDQCALGPGWYPTGATSAMNLKGKNVESLNASTTLGGDVRYG